MYNSCKHIARSEAYLLRLEGRRPLFRPDFVSHIGHRLSSVRRPEASGHPDPDFRDDRFNSASMRAAAPPAGGTPLATGSTTETGRSTGLPSGRAGTAAG